MALLKKRTPHYSRPAIVRRSGSARASTAADGMNDLHFITFRKTRIGVLGARYDLAIDLDRNPALPDVQALDQHGDRQVIRQGFDLSVDT